MTNNSRRFLQQYILLYFIYSIFFCIGSFRVEWCPFFDSGSSYSLQRRLKILKFLCLQLAKFVQHYKTCILPQERGKLQFEYEQNSLTSCHGNWTLLCVFPHLNDAFSLQFLDQQISPFFTTPRNFPLRPADRRTNSSGRSIDRTIFYWQSTRTDHQPQTVQQTRPFSSDRPPAQATLLIVTDQSYIYTARPASRDSISFRAPCHSGQVHSLWVGSRGVNV